MRRAAAVLLLSALAVAVRADAIDDFVRARMSAEHIPGVSIAILRDGHVDARPYGIANVETGTPVRPETVFRIASMSKAFCAAAALLLERDGTLRLDDPVSRFVPEAPASWAPITLRHLMTQTAGIPNTLELKEFDFERMYTVPEIIALVRSRPVDFPAGTKFHYSNTNYAVLGWALERATGRPLADVIAERVLRPARMDATRSFRLHEIVPQRASGYQWQKDHIENAWPLRPPAMEGSGAILSSVLDLAKWDAALYTDQPLPMSLRDAMFSPTPLSGGGTSKYGFGWYLDGPLHRHTGTTDGFTSAILRDPARHLTVIVLRNASVPGSLEMAREIMRLAGTK